VGIDKTDFLPEIDWRVVSMRFSRLTLLLFPLLLMGFSPLVEPVEIGPETSSDFDPDAWRSFTIDKNRILNAVGSEGASFIPEGRPTLAISRLGIHGVNGTLLGQELPAHTLLPRSDLALLIIDGDVELTIARSALAQIEGLEVREYISPSGLVVQGTSVALLQAGLLDQVAASLDVPLAMMADDYILAAWSEDASGYSLVGMEARIEGWRNNVEATVPDTWLMVDEFGLELRGDVASVGKIWLEESKRYDSGRHEGELANPDIAGLLSQPEVGWVRQVPIIGVDNDRSRDHMEIDDFQSSNPYFTSSLDGSGEIIAVADTGVDHDHGDFGTRIDAKVDMVGDGSTADTDSGHGTHVACTVLGDGTRGGYKGVASGANLYFQAMEQDSSGNMFSASINYLVNTAYNNGARTHTNSWGSQDTSINGQYTSDSEDIDDRANYYDRYYSGRQGMTILFAAGNDGPDPGSIGPPSTAKNSVTVGMHQSRYSGAPDTIMSGSGRGPTDDGRIKPDVLAPGGYIRSCRAQEAQDTSGSSWTQEWYMEYTGTSMATPNAAGAAALVREYLTEIALRPEPQGALVKALLVLGAEDVGSSNIPNNNEGWGRINLKNTLAPSGNRGIWVDDRSVLSNSGSAKTYSFEVEQSSLSFKAVLTWSDERGSRFSNKQLVNDLDLEVEAPDGTIYLGNVFAGGKSQVGGVKDSVNNLEVVLIDVASVGTWKVHVRDSSHGGSTSQPFAIAISGNGVNDLRPDPKPLQATITTDVAIPQVGDTVMLSAQIENLGNVVVEDVLVNFEVNDNLIDSSTIDLSPAELKTVYWYWTPTTAGNNTIEIEVDPNDTIEEIRENNNLVSKVIGVTTPGVRLSASQQTKKLLDSDQSVTSWRVEITNTALLETNASLSSNGVVRLSDSQSYSWYVGLSNLSFALNGSQSGFSDITLIHPTPPDPGVYAISLTGYDSDNDISFPYQLLFEVPILAKASVSVPSLVVVSPVEQSNFSVELSNDGNDDIGYNLFLESPTGWTAGFTDLGAQAGAPLASSGAIGRGASIDVGITVYPPISMVSSGIDLTLILRIVSQTDDPISFSEEINLRVGVYEDLEISLESTLGMLRPDSQVNLQFSVFNDGNTNVNLSPSIQLPGGWSAISGMGDFTVDYGDGHNWLVGIKGNGYAVSGQMTLILSSESGQIEWSTNLSVFSVAKPSIEFSSITYPDNSTYSAINGGGSHQPTAQYHLTWKVENDGDGDWSPIAELMVPTGYSGECQPFLMIESGGDESITCSVEIPANAMPNLQPQIVLKLTGGGLEISDYVSLIIAEVHAAEWVNELLPELETGTQHMVKLRIENTGNSQLSHVVEVESPESWKVVIDSGQSVTLESGQSASIRLFVTAMEAGNETCTIRLTNADGVEGSEHSFILNATGESQTQVAGKFGDIIMWSSLAIIIIGGLVAIAIILIRDRKTEKTFPQALAHPNQAQVNQSQQYEQYVQSMQAQNTQSAHATSGVPTTQQPTSNSQPVPHSSPSPEQFSQQPQPAQEPQSPAPEASVPADPDIQSSSDETETEVVEEEDESVAEIESEWADSTDPDDPWA